MKKLTALIMSLALALCMSVNVFAADANITTNGGSASTDVTGTYVAGAAGDTVYKVDIAWSDMSFTYNAASEGTWDPETHTYSDGTNAGWGNSTGTITVTNHSNAAITATTTYAAEAGYADATMTFSGNGVLTLATADNGTNGAAGTPTSGTITVTPGGTLPEGTNNAKIGTITVTINAASQDNGDDWDYGADED